MKSAACPAQALKLGEKNGWKGGYGFVQYKSGDSMGVNGDLVGFDGDFMDVTWGIMQWEVQLIFNWTVAIYQPQKKPSISCPYDFVGCRYLFYTDRTWWFIPRIVSGL